MAKVTKNKSVVGHFIGSYGPEFDNRPFKAINAQIPPGYGTTTKLSWDATQLKLRHIFLTDKGNFYGPAIRNMEPNELVDEALERVHTCFPVTFNQDLDILGVLCVDMENMTITQPLENKFPILIRNSTPIEFKFTLPYFIQGKRALCKK